ncbi:unnamed protein product [Didymodactylos carnosus]|uniref:Transcription initiation factor IIE subunit beta n=1 Tax=Didymodactylos carnosus TaxID=1234261 RepID=A0A813RWZ0_9BILA|nr:unnamed protein product [Didymodactylos carnosus]CAF0800503.1 unnamed protein product [Didymodactylos carnosus]CAF3572965.1 unnamed protein product [Didymodactylos carnosus]CAF3583832.1 unnamed protein product [Didymodactylos carnosus]
MNAALLKDVETFKRKAASSISLTTTNTSEKKPRTEQQKTSTGTRPKQQQSRPKPSESGESRTSSGGTGNPAQFRTLQRIVEHLKTRHLTNVGSHPLTLDEIIQECTGLIVDSHIKNWLATEALVDNPKIEVKIVDNQTKFCYKPPLEIKGKKTLLQLLRKQHKKCGGAIRGEDVRESISNADKIIKDLKESEAIIVLPGEDKKDILFFNDREHDLPVNEEFITAWRDISVDGLDEDKIRTYLEQEGLTAMEGTARAPTQKTKPAPRHRVSKKHNVHVQLEDYSAADVNKFTK